MDEIPFERLPIGHSLPFNKNGESFRATFQIKSVPIQKNPGQNFF